MSGGINGSPAEEEMGAGLTVVPYGQGGPEMGGFDECAAIEGSVNGTEAQYLRFAAAGGGSIDIGAAFTPELAGGVGAAEEDFTLALRPVKGAAQITDYRGKLVRGEASAVGQGSTALHIGPHIGPETTAGKSIVGFGASEMVGELTGRDMGDHAEVRVGGAEKVGSIVRVEVATIPGRAEQRGELAGIVAEQMEDGGELLSEQEEAPIGGGVFIAQEMKDAVGSRAGGVYAARDPERIGLVEEVGDRTPAASFAGLAGFTDQYNEEIKAVTGGADHAMRCRANHVAEGGKELQQDGHGIGIDRQREGADGEPGKTVEGCVRESRRRGRWRMLGGVPVKQLHAEDIVCSCHKSTLIRFLFER